MSFLSISDDGSVDDGNVDDGNVDDGNVDCGNADHDHLRKTTRCIAVRNSSRDRQPSLGTEVIINSDNLHRFTQYPIWLMATLDVG